MGHVAGEDTGHGFDLGGEELVVDDGFYVGKEPGVFLPEVLEHVDAEYQRVLFFPAHPDFGNQACCEVGAGLDVQPRHRERVVAELLVVEIHIEVGPDYDFLRMACGDGSDESQR